MLASGNGEVSLSWLMKRVKSLTPVTLIAHRHQQCGAIDGDEQIQEWFTQPRHRGGVDMD